MTRAATRVRYNGQEATPEPSRTTRKRQSLIGNGMHSAANATALKSATYIFLIGNELHFQRAPFQRIFAHESGRHFRHQMRPTVRMASRQASSTPNKSFLIFSFPVLSFPTWPYFPRHGARNHTSLLRHALRSNPLTPLRTGAPIVAGMAPSARGAEACPRYR